MGDEARPIYETKASDHHTFEDVIKIMTEKFACKRSVFAERVTFGQAKRLADESIQQFATRLKQLSKYCGFANVEEAILQQLVIGCDVEAFKSKAVRTDSLTLQDAIDLAKRYEREKCDRDTVNSAAEGRRTTSHINYTSAEQQPKQGYYNNNQRERFKRPEATRSESNGSNCARCGRREHTSTEECPAQGVKCVKCGKLNHYARVCRSGSRAEFAGAKSHFDAYKSRARTSGHSGANSHNSTSGHSGASSHNGGMNSNFKTVRGTTMRQHNSSNLISSIATCDDSISDNHQVSSVEYAEFLQFKAIKAEGLFAVSELNPSMKKRRAQVRAAGVSLTMLIDTGAPINIIDERAYAQMRPAPELQPCNTRYCAYQQEQPLAVLGQFITHVEFRGRSVEAGFVVIKGEAERLLSGWTAERLGILKWCIEEDDGASNERVWVTPVDKSNEAPLTIESIKQRFPRLCSGGLGCIKGKQVKLEVDETVKPVQQRLRQIAIHLRDAVGRELDAQEKAGILERVTRASGPTPWVSNLVVVPKGGAKRRATVTT